MAKIKKNFRLSENIVRELEEVAKKLNISETEVVSRAIHSFYLQMTAEDKKVTEGNLISLAEYRRLQEEIKKYAHNVGVLQGQLQVKDELIEELRNRIKELQAKPSRKWWEFWR